MPLTTTAVRPESGALLLPLLTLDLPQYRANRDALLRYGQAHAALLAPHVKTAMIPELALDFVSAGGWGVTVADIRQATVMIEAGIQRILLANEVGGVAAARHLARLALAHPKVELSVFADSPEAVAALAAAWRELSSPRPLSVIIELGAGRAGARDLDAFSRVLRGLVEAERRGELRVDGVGAYEGAAAVPDAGETIRRIDDLMEFAAEALRRVRAAVGGGRRLIATAGGSIYFDRAVAGLAPVVRADGDAELILRPGAVLFGDHGLYERGFAAMDAREGFELGGAGMSETFRPVLAVFAEVLSRPEPGLAICGMGMRNVPYDAGLPRALRHFRDGIEQASDLSGVAVERLNDQHAFLSVKDAPIAVGDVLAFGISHPCTCLHLWRRVETLDGSGNMMGALRTRFD